MRKVVLFLLFFAVMGAFRPQQPRSLADLDKEVTALRSELADVKRELDLAKNQIFHNTSPWRMIEHVLWDPDDPQSVERMKLALRGNYFNHGGLLRVRIGKETVEVRPGVFVDFQPPAWSVISTWPPNGGR